MYGFSGRVKCKMVWEIRLLLKSLGGNLLYASNRGSIPDMLELEPRFMTEKKLAYEMFHHHRYFFGVQVKRKYRRRRRTSLIEKCVHTIKKRLTIQLSSRICRAKI